MSRCRVRRCAGSVGDTAVVRTGVGGGRGVRSRSRIGSRIDFPDDESMRISHEAIYQALYVQGRGALRRELTACLRTGRALRVPRARTAARQAVRDRRGPDQRAAGRGRRPGRPRPLGRRSDPRARQLRDRDAGGAHHAVSRCCCTCRRWTARRPRVKNGPALAGHGAEAVRDAIAAAITTLPEQLRRSLVLGPGRRDGPTRAAADRHRPARSTSATRTAPGSAAPTRTPTACCASTSRRAPTSLDTAPTTSPRSQPRSTADLARHSAGEPQPKPSTSTCSLRPAPRSTASDTAHGE